MTAVSVNPTTAVVLASIWGALIVGVCAVLNIAHRTPTPSPSVPPDGRPVAAAPPATPPTQAAPTTKHGWTARQLHQALRENVVPVAAWSDDDADWCDANGIERPT
jgi:hypothetical protein